MPVAATTSAMNRTPSNARRLCDGRCQAGWSSVRRVPIEVPFNNLYEVVP